MTAIEKQRLERAAKVAQVIAEHPDLPIKVLAPNRPSVCDSYWCDVTGARVAWLLYPDEVQGSAFDSDSRRYVWLSYERIYSDKEDAVEDVAEWLFERWFDFAHDHGMSYENSYTMRNAMDDRLTSTTMSTMSRLTAWPRYLRLSWSMTCHGMSTS